MLGLLSAAASSAITAYPIPTWHVEDPEAGQPSPNPLMQFHLSLPSLVASTWSRAIRSSTTFVAQHSPGVPALLCIPPLLCLLVTCLIALSSRAQARSVPPPKLPRYINYFTDQLSTERKHLRTHLRQAYQSPLSYMLTAAHALLLFFILCPMSKFVKGLKISHR